MGAALLDVIFAMAVMATLAIAMLTVVNNGARDELARAYARQFRLTMEDACPAAFGKSFWFVCASEVRRINGTQHPVPPPTQSGPRR